jgi:hypothetical protein
MRPPLQGRLQYEIFWERDPALKEAIDSAWRDTCQHSDLGSISAGLSAVMRKLQVWGKRKFGNVTRELARLREKLKLTCMILMLLVAI